MFEKEIEMSFLFEKFLRSSFGNAYIKECKGLFGIPDFLCYDKSKTEICIICFELKLYNWRKAVKQAFRHKSFANIVYVVLDRQQAQPAINNINIFKNYNIGLAVFDTNKDFHILYKPSPDLPYSENLTQKVKALVTPYRKKAKNTELLVA